MRSAARPVGPPTAELALRARSGRFSLTGWAAPAQFWTGKKQRLAAPIVRIAGSAGLADRQLDAPTVASLAALKVETAGILDLARKRLPKSADRRRPAASVRALHQHDRRQGARDRLAQRPLRPFSFAYRLSSPRVAFDQTGFEGVVAEGKGQWSQGAGIGADPDDAPGG